MSDKNHKRRRRTRSDKLQDVASRSSERQVFKTHADGAYIEGIERDAHKAEAPNGEEYTYFESATILHDVTPVEIAEAPKEVKKKQKPKRRPSKNKSKTNKLNKQEKQNNTLHSASYLPTAERALDLYRREETDDSVEDSSIETFYMTRMVAEETALGVVTSAKTVKEKAAKKKDSAEEAEELAAFTTDTPHSYTSHTAASQTSGTEQNASTATSIIESQEEHKAKQKQLQKKHLKRRQIAYFRKTDPQDTHETVGFAAYIREKLLSRNEDKSPKGRAKTTVAIILLIALAAVLIVALVSSASMLIEVLTSYLAISTYPSDDSDMLAAERQYCRLEDELQQYPDNYESTHDYDEYNYELDDIGHDPYVLISCITAKVDGEWSIGEVSGIIQDLFERQYELKEEVETAGEKTVCTVTLNNNDLAMIPGEILDEEQLSRYAIYMAVLGNRPDLFPDSEYIGKYINGEYQVYEIAPEALEDEKFAAMIEEAEKYLGYPYVWGGSSPSTSFDCSGYICWILNHSGWSVGRTTAQGLFNSCTPVSRGNARPGDLVFFTGTYKTEDKCSHVGLYVGENMMLHCGDPITYTSIASDYWQSHFYAFARLP